MKKKTLAIFGATGSIGTSALDVFKNNKDKFKLIYLSAHNNLTKLEKLNKKFKPRNIIITNKNISQNKNKFFNFLDSKKIFLNKKKIDISISGISGFTALEFNLKLLKISKKLLIANKETLICGGELFLKLAKKENCEILPIDSEHHCIDYFLKSFKLRKEIDKYYITASGGPFLNKKTKYNEKIKNVLMHPTWKMGKNISVNSATMANKVLELFEAVLLFNINKKNIKIKIEKNSIIHAIIKLKNNVYFPILHSPKMKIPLSNALGVKNYCDLKISDYNFSLIEPNYKKFPLIKLGYKIINNYGHSGMIIFTVLNEKLVNMYLKNKIKFGHITNTLVKIFNSRQIKIISQSKNKNINDIYKLIDRVSNLKV